MCAFNKPPLKRGKVGSVFLMRETQKGYSDCTPIKWWFVVCVCTVYSFCVCLWMRVNLAYTFAVVTNAI